jgi:hypothetical protein
MEAFLHWRGFDVPCASEIPNAGIVLAGRDRWQVDGLRGLRRIVSSYSVAALELRSLRCEGVDVKI